MRNNNQSSVQIEQIKELAKASSTPFMTGFKVTLGVAAAQFLIGLTFLFGIGLFVATAAAIVFFLFKA